MVESSDYDHEIDNEAQRKLNHEFQSMRFELKSNLLEGVCLPQGEKENDG